MARVSNPNANPTDDASRLIKYLITHGHWSPFEMVNACVEINTTRDISRQILRHRSFTFQEFSGRYAAYESFSEPRAVRMQDPTNRQSSNETDDQGLHTWWREAQEAVQNLSTAFYQESLDRGIAKEVARAILPEGLTPTKMYMNGTLRSWIHYFQVRCTPETQKEHRVLAEGLRGLVLSQFPMVQRAINDV